MLFIHQKLRQCWYCYMDALHGRWLNRWRKSLMATTQILWAILNKSWRQHHHKTAAVRPPTSHHENYQRLTRHAGHCSRSRNELISDVLLWTLLTWLSKSRATSSNLLNSSSVRIRDVGQRICQKRWTIGRSGERVSGRSMLVAWHDTLVKNVVY